MYYDEDPTTTEQLTVVQINQLKDAWQRANAELVKYKDIAYNLQQKVENLTSAINDSYNQLELESAKSQISQLCCASPNIPILLIKELSKTLPKMNYHSLVATAFIKTGESWIALSSSSVSQETINFKSRLFDEMLRFRSRSRTSRVTVESLPNILPLPVVNYIHSGTVPATESAFDMFNDDSKGHGTRARRGERSAAAAQEHLYHETIIVRLINNPDDDNTEETDQETTLSERIVWLITVAPQHQSNNGVDIITEEIPLRRLAVDHFGAHVSVVHANSDYFNENAPVSEECAIARDFWYPLLAHTAQVVMTSLLHHFEAKRIHTQVLQSEAVTEFTSLLHHSSSEVEVALDDEGKTTSYGSSALLETMSQRSEEDDVLQSHTLQDDAYWDNVWQSVPSALENFLVQHVEGLSSSPEEYLGESSRVQRSCRCEIYLTSSTLVDEVNSAHSGAHHTHQDSTSPGRASPGRASPSHGYTSGVVTDLPLVNSKRVVSALRLRETEGSTDGQAEALNTVLCAALLRDTAAVQSFSEVSFHERSQPSYPERGSSKNNKSATGSTHGGARAGSAGSSAENGPHVEFHTVIAVPLLRSTHQGVDGEIGAVKGCILVHVTSILVEQSLAQPSLDSTGGALTRAHPMYASSFTANSTSTHSAYMEHIAGSYNLLESGRQPIVLGVVETMDVLGDMLLNFLFAHNCRPLNLLPMSTTESGADRDGDTGAESASSGVVGKATTSYADASRWNTCLTDGLFSLLTPLTAAATRSASASLESLSFNEESKSTFATLSQDRLQHHNSRGVNSFHGALIYHLCTLFHSDWALVFTSDSQSSARGAHEGHRTARFSVQDEESESMQMRLIDNTGASRTLAAHHLPAACRNAITHSLTHGNAQTSNLKHTNKTASHDFIKEIAGIKNVPIAELLTLLEVEPRLKHSIHQMCDSSAAAHLHHTVAVCLDSRGSVSLGADSQAKRRAQTGDHHGHRFPAATNIVIITGRFLRGPFYTPLLSTPTLSQLGVLFQTALARRELILVQETVDQLLAERSLNHQEVACTESLEVELSKLHQRTLSHGGGNIASLVAFRKGLLGVLIDFFASMHKLHFASYTPSGADSAALALEVIGIELVVDESTGFDQGRHRKWALSAGSADWVRVADDTEHATEGLERTARKRVILAQPVQTLHSQLSTAELAPAPVNLTAEVLVDALTGVYQETGASVLHVHRKARQNTTSEDGDESIGMSATILVHYEYPVTQAPTTRGKHSPREASSTTTSASGRFFSALQSAPMWMRILRNFIGTNSQALFQPLYPIYTLFRLHHQTVSIDEEQQWEDDALHAQASNLAITALSTAIVQDSSRLLSGVQNAHHDVISLSHQQHPHYRYLHQRRLLRQLTVVPPFSAFMLIPIRELTTSEISVFDDDSSSENSDLSVEVDLEDVRYVHLLPPAVHRASSQAPVSQDHRKKSANPFAQSVLPMKLNTSVRDALRSVRSEQHSADSNTNTTTSEDRARTSRLTVLDGGMGGVLHIYLSELHEKQQRRRAHSPGSHEYDLYGYVDVAAQGAGEKSSKSHREEMALVDPHSLVLLYTPLLNAPKKTGFGVFEENEGEEGVLAEDTAAALDHYYLIVCRQDRMIVPSSLARLQSCLDELFLPSRVLAASQPWFECMSGIEQLVKAATVGSKVEFKPDATEGSLYSESVSDSVAKHRSRVPQELGVSHSAPIMSVEGQCQRILIETISIMKRVMGERCLGAVGYQLRIDQNELPDLLGHTQESGGVEGYGSASGDMYRAGKEIELVRCCSDVGVATTRNGKVLPMLQGPSKLQCPATTDLIVNRFVHPNLRDQRATMSALGHSPVRGHGTHSHAHGHAHTSHHNESRGVSIHYVEMSSLEHIKQLQHSANSGNVINASERDPAESAGATPHTRKTGNVAAVQELISAAHGSLRADVRVIQLLITSSPTDTPAYHSRREVQIERMPEHVVASVLIYVSTAETDGGEGREEEELPTFTYINRADIQHNGVAEVVSSRAHRRAQSPSWVTPHTSVLSKGILSCMMRVGDTTGALVSSLYRQQYDSYLQAFNTRTKRAAMATHAQRLANTLLQIQQEITHVVGEDQPQGTVQAMSPTPAKARQSTPKKNLSSRFDSASHTHGEEDGEFGAVPLADADQQRLVAEQAVDALQVLLERFYSLKQHYGHEQLCVVEMRSKYKASMEECRIKASQFRAFFEAIQRANAILPLPVTDIDDMNSLNSGLDKVAANNATVPETHVLQRAVASAVCNTQTLRKAFEILAELAAHEEFAGYFNSMLASLSQCSLDDGATALDSINEDEEEAEGFNRILQVAEVTPFARAKQLDAAPSSEEAPDIFATVWWVLEPGSHINAINLANAVQNVTNSLDVNTLHSKEKFLEALNTKNAVLVEGEELLQMLPHLLAFFSARGHSEHNSFPTVRLLYQPVLATLPRAEEEVVDDASYSSRDTDSAAAPGETVVVAVVQYVLSGGRAGTLHTIPLGAGVLTAAHTHHDGSSLGEGSAAGSEGGDDPTSLSAVLRQVGRDRLEQSVAYMGQHITNLSKIAPAPTVAAPSTHGRSGRFSQHALTVAMNHHVPRLLLENNVIGGIHWSALVSALKFIVDPTLLPPSAIPSAVDTSGGSQASRSASSGGSVRSGKSKRSSSGSVRSQSASSRSVRTSQTSKSANAEKIAAAAVYNPLSVWVGKVLAVLMRADAASMLHVTGSVKSPKARQNAAQAGAPGSDGASAAERYSNVVYEGVLYKYGHGVVSGGSANDDRSSLNILHVRPSSWTPLQHLIERYQSFFANGTAGHDVYVSYQESVLSYTRKASTGPVYSSRSVATTSAGSAYTEAAHEGGKMCYILAGAINTSSVHPSSTATPTVACRKNVHFYDTEGENSDRIALKENDDFLVVELSRRPSSADIKAFSSVLQLVQAFICAQGQRNQIKQRDAELGSISNALASSSQKLVEEQQENLQHRQFADLMSELQRQQGRAVSERSVVSSAVSVDSAQHTDRDAFAPSIGDIVRGVQQTQDMLCDVLGVADSAELLSAPRMICNEVQNLLKSDTISVASRGSNIEDELMGARIDTVTRNLSKRALGKIMHVEYAPMGPNGHVNYAEYQNAADVQYESARHKFAALAVQLNVVLVCDVADSIVEEAISLNLGVNKASVPAIARSIMVPVVDHAPEPPIASLKSDNPNELSFYDEDQLHTSRLSWIDPALQSSVSNILDSAQVLNGSPERGAAGGFYQQFQYDLRQRQKQAAYATTSTVQNASHAWALQIVFPTLEARDQYVTKLLGGGNSTTDPTSALSTPASSPGSSPNKYINGVTSRGSPLPLSFLSGVSQFLKNSFVHCRRAVLSDVEAIQSSFEQALSDRVTVCMDQVLLMSLPADHASVTASEGDVSEPRHEKDLPMEFNVDEIAASVAHVFQNFKGKLNGTISTPADADSASDSEESTPEEVPTRTASTFECCLVDAHLHWSNLPAPLGDKKGQSVRFADTHTEKGALRDFKVGAWLTVALNPPPEKVKPADSAEEEPADVKAPAKASGKTKPASSKSKVEVLAAEEEEEATPKSYKVTRDETLYKRCKLKQWQTQRTALSGAQIQAVRDSVEGFMLFAVPAPKAAPKKETRSARSQSPNAHFSMHGGAAGYSSTTQGSRQRPGSVFGSVHSTNGFPIDEGSTGVGEYLNPDGSVNLQLLVLITGSEQPAILELRVRCHLTSGDSSPGVMTRYTGRRRAKKHTETVIDELALAEMMEQVACLVLQPTLPAIRLVRSSMAHLLEHCVAARGLVQWEAEWESFMQHAQQRISLLSNCLTLLTSEGNKASGLLQLVQETLCRLPALSASTLICRDTTTHQIIYNRTIDYSNGQVGDLNFSASGSVAATPQHGNFMSPTPSSSHGQFNFPDSAFSDSAPQHKVSYMDLSRDPRNRPPEHNTPLGLRPSDLSLSTQSLKAQYGHIESVNPALDNLEQLELVFECYEVQGSLTVYFAPGEAANFAADLRNSADFQSGGLFSPTASTARSPSASRRAASPYEPLRSPSAHRRAREAQRRLQINTNLLPSTPTAGGNGGVDGNSGRFDTDREEFVSPEHKRRELVSLNTLLETIVRAMARRVFELHRGSKNKKMMASKQQELSKRTTQLQQEAEKVSTLEAMNTMSRQELQTAAVESERLRLLMYAEQRNLKEALKQKKEMNAHLRQSLLEQRQESDTRALVSKKQHQELREKIAALEQAKQKEMKELDRVRSKGVASENATSTLTYQLAEVQRLHKTSEATVRQLRTDLALAQKELSAYTARDRVRNDGDDTKTKGFLTKIARLDDELAAAKGTNAFLKKQLEATSLSLKIAQEENARGPPHYTTSTGRSASYTHTVNTVSGVNLHSSTLSGAAATPNGAHRARTPPHGAQRAQHSQPLTSASAAPQPTSPLYDEMAQSLQREQQNTAVLRKQLQDMSVNQERR